ncbi:MAG: hypothetical protein ABIG11_06090 [bacterium]
MKMKRIAVAVLMLVCASGLRYAWSVDNATEFGIEDDLTVLGTEGTLADPDAEIKGFSMFGPTAGAAGPISPAPGNVLIRGNLQADATSYFGSSVTIAGYGVFLSTVQINTNLEFPGATHKIVINNNSGATGEVLKIDGSGNIMWGTDATGAGDITGTKRRLPMFDPTDGVGVVDTYLRQDDDDAGMTLLNNSSITITGAFESQGAATLVNGLSVSGGNAAITNNLTVNGITNLGNLAGTDKVNITADVTLLGTSSMTVGGFSLFKDSVIAAGYGVFQSTVQIGANALKIPGGTAAQVLKNDGAGFAYWADDATVAGDVTGTQRYIPMFDPVDGIGVVDSKLRQDDDNAGVTLISGSSMTVTGELLVSSNTRLGDSNIRDHGINVVPEDGVALKVEGEAGAGTYSAKFYSGADLAAWIKKK